MFDKLADVKRRIEKDVNAQFMEGENDMILLNAPKPKLRS